MSDTIPIDYPCPTSRVSNVTEELHPFWCMCSEANFQKPSPPFYPLQQLHFKQLIVLYWNICEYSSITEAIAVHIEKRGIIILIVQV